jgi:hypothetical protein
MAGPPRPLLPLPLMAFPALPRPFAAPFMNPLPPVAAVVGPAPNPNHHPIGLAFPLPFPVAPRPAAPALHPAHPLYLPIHLMGLDPPTRRNSAEEETGMHERLEDYEPERFAPPTRGRRDSDSSSSSSSSSDSDRMGKGSQLKF